MERSNEFFKNIFITINWIALLSSLLLVSIAISAVFAPFIAPTNPYDLSTVSILDSRLSPGEIMFSGNVAFLGTDGAGRDMVSAIFYGLRVSLGVGVLSGIFALSLFVKDQNKIYLIRDQVGVKPLYYSYDTSNKRLIYSSLIYFFLLRVFLHFCN